MITAFKERKPWPSAVIGFIFGPTLGMFYLGRGWLGIGYIPVAILVGLVPAWIALEFQLSTDPNYLSLVASLGLMFVAGIHCTSVARRTDGPRPDRWFARWYALLVFWLLPILSALLIRTFLWEPYNTPAGSMSPTLKPDTHFFVSKFAYGYGSFTSPFLNLSMEGADPERGDVVVFRHPKQPGIELREEGNRLAWR